MNVYNENGFPRQMSDFYRATKEEMKWFRDARFGMFVHWGPAALCGGDISWCRKGPRPGDHPTVLDPGLPAEEYDKLYQRFNPIHFDADEWIDTVKAAGMKYFVIVTKHHDGFSLFDTRYSAHRSTAADCPCGKDIIRLLSDACHRNGIKFGIYYSARDWYHPDYLVEDNTKYLQFYTSQLVELLTNYGRIDLLWFDHIGGAFEEWNPDTILKLARALHPGILINDRMLASVHGQRIPEYTGDFYTPEQQVGKFDNQRPWESCLCLVGGIWSYKPSGVMMTKQEVIRNLVSCVGGDGNLLLNNGPMPDGRIEPRQRDRLKEIGTWLAKYGEAIHGTRGGPVLPCDEYACTCKGNTYYLHILKNGSYTFTDIPGQVQSIRILSGSASVTEQNGAICVADAILDSDFDVLIQVVTDTSFYPD